MMYKLKKWWQRQRSMRAMCRMQRKTGLKYFRRACLKAEQLSRENNTRYRVYLFDEYRALSREDLTRMKNRGIIDKKQNTGIGSKDVLYDTLTHKNLHPQFFNDFKYKP